MSQDKDRKWHKGKLIGRFVPSGAELYKLPDGRHIIMIVILDGLGVCPVTPVDLVKIYQTEEFIGTRGSKYRIKRNDSFRETK